MGSSGGFWTSAQQVDPKRKFRFLVTIGGMPDGAQWYAKGVNKPEITIDTAEHQFLNHTFYYPGGAKWNEVTVTMVDPVSPDASVNLSRILLEAGYKPPTSVNDQTTISKKSGVAAVGSVIVEQIDSEGNAVETWTLNNAFVTKINYGGDLAYGENALIDMAVTFRYDWASIETALPADPGLNGTPGDNRYWNVGQA